MKFDDKTSIKQFLTILLMTGQKEEIEISPFSFCNRRQHGELGISYIDPVTGACLWRTGKDVEMTLVSTKFVEKGSDCPYAE